MQRTRELRRRSYEVLGFGGHQRLLPWPLDADDEGVFPEFVEEARGCELIDTNGRSFVDWSSARGPMLLGYRRPEVERAIQEQLRAGPQLPLVHPIEIEVATMLIEMIPCAEMVAFGKNGSDVLTAAVRVARASTGRELILQFGYHGFHDWYTCQYSDQDAKGIPKVLRSLVHPFPYNDLDALVKLFDRYPEEVAAVVMEPVMMQMPEPGYLEGVRELTRRRGALLVFDEMVTGFRLANGGAQELFGVIPDLACVGKALANGMPLAALVGKREHMRHARSVAYGMTAQGETLSLAAARAVLRILLDEPVAEHIARVGTQVREAFDRACAAEGVLAKLTGPPARMTFVFDAVGSAKGQGVRSLFLRECARHGVLTYEVLIPSYAHDDAAIERTVQAFEASLRTVGDALRASVEARSAAVRDGFISEGPLGAEPSGQPSSGLPAGALDFVGEEGAALQVVGWMLFEDGPADVVEFLAASGEGCVATPCKRPDVAEAFPGAAGAEDSGYRGSLPASVFALNGDFEFTIRGLRGSRTAFQCPVVMRRRGGSGPPMFQGACRDKNGTLYL